LGFFIWWILPLKSCKTNKLIFKLSFISFIRKRSFCLRNFRKWIFWILNFNNKYRRSFCRKYFGSRIKFFFCFSIFYFNSRTRILFGWTKHCFKPFYFINILSYFLTFRRYSFYKKVFVKFSLNLGIGFSYLIKNCCYYNSLTSSQPLYLQLYFFY
jgi:hypothetical protein